MAGGGAIARQPPCRRRIDDLARGVVAESATTCKDMPSALPRLSKTAACPVMGWFALDA
jgi:hypothetical protein